MKNLILLLFAALCPFVAFPFGFKAEEIYTEGMHWEGYYETLQQDKRFYFDFFIEGETEMLGEKCYKLWRNSENFEEPKLEMLVRPQGDKVYFVTSLDASQWSLLYDFKPSLFQSCTIQYPMPWGIDSFPYAFELKCMQWFNVYDTDPGYELMFLQKFDENLVPEGYAGQWIRGFGNVGFPTQNILGMEGDMRSHLIRAYNGNQIFYENKTVSTDFIYTDDYKIEQSGLTVNISGLVNSQEVSIVSIDGKVIFNNKSFAESLYIELPDPGIYIIKTGNKATKIIAK